LSRVGKWWFLLLFSLLSSVLANRATASTEQAWSDPGCHSLASRGPRPSGEQFFTVLEGVAAGGGVGLVIASRSSSPSSPHLTSHFVVDEAARDVLRLSSPSARNDVGAATTWGLIGAVAIPGLVGLSQSLCRDDGDEALKRILMLATSVALTWGVTQSVEDLVARARPCTRDEAGCSVSPYTSFFSMHTSIAFTGAGFCWAARLGWGWCVADTALATAVGIGRIMADDHYLTDVVAGAAFGAFSGAVLPHLVNIHLGPAKQPISVSILPALATGRAGSSEGLVLQGAFR
jgi:membrane-associated phospholipid phosphatase